MIKKTKDIGEDVLDYQIDFTQKNSRSTNSNVLASVGKNNQINKQSHKSLRRSKIKSLIHQNSFTKKDKIKNMRRKQPLWVYIISVFSAFLMGAENLYLFMWDIKIPWVLLSTLCLRIIFFLVVGMWLVDSWKSYIKLCFILDRVTTTGVAILISTYALCLITIPFARYPWLFESVLYVYPPFILTSMAYSRIILIFCDWKPWKTILYKIAIVLSAGSYIGVAMYFIFDPNESLNFIASEVSDSFVAIVILYSYAGFDYHIQTLSMIDQIDGTTTFQGTYQLKCSTENMEYFIYGAEINTKIKNLDSISISLQNSKKKKF